MGGGPGGMDIMGDPMLFSNADFNFSDLNPNMFTGEGPIVDFERDFGSWFNPSDGMDGSALKLE